MRYLTILGLLGMSLIAAPYAHAQRVVIGVGIGPGYVAPPPACAYGYYGYSPYACAPYGYYGPDYFSGGVFIGAGPWLHGYYGRQDFDERREFYGRPFAGRPYEDRWHGFEDGWRGGEFHGDGFQGRERFRDGENFHGRDGFRGDGRFRGGRGDRGQEGFHGERDNRGGEGFHGRGRR